MNKVSNMTSTNWNKIANQFIIYWDDMIAYQSYNSTIAIKHNDWMVELDIVYRDYSQTTGKYRNIFLQENKKETQSKINDWIYILKNLN